MKRIVVGMDDSSSARDALSWAAALANATASEVVAVNAFVPMQSEMRPGYLERLRDDQAGLLRQWCGDLLDGVRSSMTVVDGDPRDQLPAVLERLDADLLVVASRGDRSRGPGFLHTGSVVESLAHRLERPMAVIPPGSPPQITRVVVGVDGSEHGATAIRWASDIATATGASVTAIAVEEPGRPISELTDAEQWQHASEVILATEWAAPLAALEDFHGVVTRGRPVAEAIVDLAEHDHADLVVVGARGVGGFSGLRIGGTALAVLHRASRPVVLTPPSDFG